LCRWGEDAKIRDSFFQGVELVQINIAIRHGHISDETQAMVREKLEKLNRLYDRVSSIEATIDMEHRETPSVDLKVSVKKHDFVAVGQAENLLAAIDVVIDKMEQQLRKHKEKEQDRHRGTGHREEGHRE
jgi:putative sigma-54 modulation protein